MDGTTEREQISELAKRRGFFFAANEAYGGSAGFYVYGPVGAALKQNLEDAWRDRFTVKEGHLEIDSPTVMPEPVFEASGHLDGFSDMLVECPSCETNHRADHLVETATGMEDAESLTPEEIGELVSESGIECPVCGTSLADEPIDEFNLMFATNIGPGSSAPGYLRPETAQGIFVEFPRLAEYAREQLPFGVTQIGTAYRNEISPRRGLVRLREFTQAELELFIDPESDTPSLDHVGDVEVNLYPVTAQQSDDRGPMSMTIQDAMNQEIITSAWIAYYLGIATRWFDRIGIDMTRFRYRQHLAGERAHYAVDCWDAEVEIDGDWIEVVGFAYRSDYDLRKHGEYADDDFTVFKQYDEPRTVERVSLDPDMSYFGPEFGDMAPKIIAALNQLLEENPMAFKSEEVTISIDEGSYAIPVDQTGFSRDEETTTGERITPHVIEPSFGIDRLVYTVLTHSYEEDELDGEPRSRLALEPEIAPTFVGVFPLMARDGLVDRAESIAGTLRDNGFVVSYDETGSIGRRYRRQDEIGTPFCVTIDYDTLEDDTVTIRDRDTAGQRRVAIDRLPAILADLKAEVQRFDEIGVEVADA